MPTSVTFITGNAAKAEQLGRHLAFPVTHKRLDIPEIQSLDLTEVVTYKVKEAYTYLNSPVLVEDTSLRFDAFGRLPGPLIKWFLEELGNEGLCHILKGFADRSALAEVKFAYYDGTTLSVFPGSMEGQIADIPRGEKGFGWDPIFIPKGWNKTWGEMTIEEQKATSMRKLALKKLDTFLQSVHF